MWTRCSSRWALRARRREGVESNHEAARCRSDGRDRLLAECAGVALEYERAQGRSAEDVSSENLGYDLRSTAPDGAVRSIERDGHAQGPSR